MGLVTRGHNPIDHLVIKYEKEKQRIMDDLIDSYGSLFDLNGDGELDSMEKSYGFDVMNDFLSDDRPDRSSDFDDDDDDF